LVADLALLGIGWSVWSAVDADGYRTRGGVVISFDRKVDVETGETTYRFHTRAPFGEPLAWLNLRGDEIVLPDGVEPINRQRCWLIIRRICQALQPRDYGGRTLTASERFALEDAFALYLAVR
jgi:hypothetical protein